MTEKTYLSNVINYDRDIAPHRVIEIIAGVGAGKNHWVEEILMKQHRVLLITSRKAKVAETRARTGYDKTISWRTIEDLEIAAKIGFDKQSFDNIICNNAHIEYYLKNIYTDGNDGHNLWDFFDIIVLDEAHSLVTDATFTDSSFHVMSFLKAAYRNTNAKLILMTATPGPIKNIIPYIYSETLSDNHKIPTDSIFKSHNFLSICKNIVPKRVWLSTFEIEVQNLISQYHKFAEGIPTHAIYFATHKERIRELIDVMVENGMPADKIAISFSDKKTSSTNKKIKFSDDELARKEYTENYIRDHEDLPTDIFLFITTSRNKEGINLKNDDYIWGMLIESHYIEDIKQMWGRARSGLTYCAIIHDAEQYRKCYTATDNNYIISKHFYKKIYSALNEWIKEKNIDKEEIQLIKEGSARSSRYKLTETFIADIEKMFSYIRFDIPTARFLQYRGRTVGHNDYSRKIEIYDDLYESIKFYNNYDVSEFPLFDINLWWYDDVRYIDSETKTLDKEQLHKNLKVYLENNSYLGDYCITKDDEQQILATIDNMGVKNKSGKPYTQLGGALRECGFTVDNGKHRVDRLKMICEAEAIE